MGADVRQYSRGDTGVEARRWRVGQVDTGVEAGVAGWLSLCPLFNKIIINYDTGVNKKSVAYWDTTRPVPLEPEEKMDYQVKDSVFQLNKDSAQSQSSVDSLNKKQGKLKVYDVFWKGIHRTKYRVKGNYNWGIESLIKGLEYMNNAEEKLKKVKKEKTLLIQ